MLLKEFQEKWLNAIDVSFNTFSNLPIAILKYDVIILRTPGLESQTRLGVPCVDSVINHVYVRRTLNKTFLHYSTDHTQSNI